MHRKLKKLSHIGIFLLGLVSSGAVYAQSVPPTCDADYYEVLRAKTYVVGKRELEAAQRIILKPDSVLEYSCFDQELDFVGTYAGTFSDAGLLPDITPPDFNGGIGISTGHLSTNLATMVTNALIAYLKSFDHIYGGGSFAIAAPAAGGCNPMNIVWHASKCENFDTNWWLKESQLANKDIRDLPSSCDPAAMAARSNRIAAAFAAAYPLPSSPASSGGVSAVIPNARELIGSCSGALNQAVPTGIQYDYLNSGSTEADAVCIKPGCDYDGSSCN